MRFSATEAAFEGFRLVRRNPVALVFWTLAYLVLSVGSMLAMILHRDQIVEGMRTLETLSASGASSMEDISTMMDAYAQMTSYSFLVLPLSILISAMLSAAVARGVLTPDDKRFGYMRLGMDELRVFVVTVVLAILTALIAGMAFGVVMMIGSVGAVTGQAWLFLVAVLAALATFALVIWLAVRWSLAVPITVAEKKFAFFDSFRLTKGRFWPLLGMAIVAGVLSLVMWALSMIVVLPLGMMSGMSTMGMGGTDSAAVVERLTLANPLIFLNALANAIVYALMVAIVYAPFSAAYRDLKAG